MGKTAPEERWRKHVIERYVALRQSGELRKLRAEGLAILRRRRLLTAEEWRQTFSQRVSSSEYQAWHDKCKSLGERFGLAPWVVTMACLLKGYQPEKEPHVMEVHWPQLRVVTENTDSVFLARLAYEAQRLGLYVVRRQGSTETTHLYLNSVPIMTIEPPPMPLTKPPLHNAFYLRVEIPTGYPPEAAREIQKSASTLGRKLLRRLGYPTHERLRTSSLVPLARELKINKSPLPRGGIYDIIDQVYGVNDSSLDQPRRRIIKSRRSKLLKRLVEPYKPNVQDTPEGTQE